MNDISQKLKQFRKSYGITQKQLADRMDTSPMVISSWERGIRHPKKGSIIKLIDSFALTPEIQDTLKEFFNSELSDENTTPLPVDTDPIRLKKNLFGYDTYAINNYKHLLNHKGQVKVLQYIEDIAGGFRYQEKSPVPIIDMLGDESTSLRIEVFINYISEKLNNDGLKKVIDYIDDLAGNQKYGLVKYCSYDE